MNVALLYSGILGSEWDAKLTAELTSRVDIGRVVLLLGRADFAPERNAAHFRRAVERWLAHTTRCRLHLASLASNKVEVLSTIGADIAELVRAQEVDMVVDLRSAIVDVTTVAQAAPGGVYQLWHDGVAGGLDCAGLRSAQSHTIAVTLLRAGWRRPRVVQQATLTSTGAVVELDRRNASARAIALLLRTLARLGGAEIQDAPDLFIPKGALACSPARELMASVSAVAWRRLRRTWAREDAWFLAYRTKVTSFVSQGGQLSGAGFRLLDGGPSRFLADPCALRHRGVDHVFMEEYPFNLRRGVISWSYLRPDGTLSQPERVLERPYHLSYPFVFEHDGEMWMIPESAANGTVDIYRSKDFPRGWEHAGTLLEGVNAVDATLHHDGQRWWMFASIGEQGSYAWDELFLYMADQPTGPWRAHPKNPVKSDAASARPAGRLFRRGTMLLRPAQDCSRVYGGAVTLCAVDVLTETNYEEHAIETIPPSWIPGAEALHTLSASPGLEVIDARRPLRYRWPLLSRLLADPADTL